MPPAEPRQPHNGSSNALEGSFPPALPQPRKDRKGRSTLGLRELSSPPLAPASLFMLIEGRRNGKHHPVAEGKK